MMDYARSNGTYQLLSPSDEVELCSITEDVAIADITKGSPEAFAKQITLIELSLFKAIRREEFSSLKWNGKEKHIYAPNIVASTRWFNQINFWVQKEILKYSCVSKRTESLSFFIKIAKKLVDYNNLYSAMSIISALQVECIYRLRHTWAGLGNKDRSTYRRLEELFSQDDNCRRQREHMNAISLPGIPYLGLYLSDLTYTNVAFPRVDGKPSATWVTKINAIIDVIVHFQQSEYNFPVDGTLNAYLCAQRYIEELQKFLEEDNYKTSLTLEPPPAPPPPLATPCSSSAGESITRCFSPSAKDEQAQQHQRKVSGFLSADSSLRGLPALAASFHGLSFRSPSTTCSTPVSCSPMVNKTPAECKYPNNKQAASINCSFESDLTPPSKSHYHQHQLSGSSISSSCAGKNSSGTTLKQLHPINSPDLVPSTPVSRFNKRSGTTTISATTAGGRQLFPDTDSDRGANEGVARQPTCSVNCSSNFRDNEPHKHHEVHHQSQTGSLARPVMDSLPPVPPRPNQSEVDRANESRNLVDGLEDGCSPGNACSVICTRPELSAVPDQDATASSAAISRPDLLNHQHSSLAPTYAVPALIESTAVAACAAMASSSLFGYPSADCSQQAESEGRLAHHDGAAATFLRPSRPATSTPTSRVQDFEHARSPLPPTSVPSVVGNEFSVHIVYQGVIQRRSMAQVRAASSALAALLSPKMRKTSVPNSSDLYGSASSLSTSSILAATTTGVPPGGPNRSPLVHSRPNGFSSWRRLWATLVLVGQGSAAFMIYFEPKFKRAIHRNQFHAHHCQVQSLIDLQSLYHADSSSDTSLPALDEDLIPSRSMSDVSVPPELETEQADPVAHHDLTSRCNKSRGMSTPNTRPHPSSHEYDYVTAQLALGRHRDGSLDPLSFLLTDPSRSKVYRFRPLIAPCIARSTTGPLNWLRRSTTRMPGAATLMRHPADRPSGPFSFNTLGRPRGSSVPGVFTSPKFSPSTQRAATLKMTRTAQAGPSDPDPYLLTTIGPDLLVAEWMRAIQHVLNRVEQFHQRQLVVRHASCAIRKNTV